LFTKSDFWLPGDGRGHGCHCVRRLSRVACHFFTIGMTATSNAFFAISTFLVGVPTGIRIFNWNEALGQINYWTGSVPTFVFRQESSPMAKRTGAAPAQGLSNEEGPGR